LTNFKGVLIGTTEYYQYNCKKCGLELPDYDDIYNEDINCDFCGQNTMYPNEPILRMYELKRINPRWKFWKSEFERVYENLD